MNIGKILNKKMHKILIVIISILLINFIVIMPTVTVIIYESVFSTRFETSLDARFEPSDFAGLEMYRCDFQSQKVTLAGYKYTDGDDNAKKGVVVISHGMGGGGHNSLMPYIAEFVKNGYLVFAYDSRGTDASGGKDTNGFPQSLIDLDNALHHISAQPEYQNLPVKLFGHSCGAYAVGNVLNMHPEVSAAVMISGFDESEDMLEYYGSKYVGFLAKATIGYVRLYERIKFGGEFTELSAIDGMKKTDAKILIAHSSDDKNVPVKCGYDKYYNEFGSLERFEFVLYEDRGHTDLLYSDKEHKTPNPELMQKILKTIN